MRARTSERRSRRRTRALRGGVSRAVVLGCTVWVALPASARAQASAAPAEEPLVVSYRDAAWGPPGTTPRFPQGVQTAQLGVDPEQGDYVVNPGRMSHSWDVPAGEAVVILVRRTGPADFNFVNP